jgi:hypothetical protein
MNIRFLLALLLVLLSCSRSTACTCFGASQAKSMRDVAEWHATRPEISLVFEGKVVKQEVRSGSLGGPATAMSMTLSGRHRVVEFDVTRVFRGTNQTHLTVVTGMANGDCGYDFWPEKVTWCTRPPETEYGSPADVAVQAPSKILAMLFVFLQGTSRQPRICFRRKNIKSSITTMC